MSETDGIACFQPEYMSVFQCDGRKCNALCCSSKWRIDFDSDTYAKYCSIEPRSKRESILKWLEYKEEHKTYVLKRPETGNGSCPMLRSDCLCGIQKEYGEDYLSLVCLSYPRHVNIIDDFVERSLSLSCPLAAELILLHKEPMAFEQCTVPDNRLHRHGQVSLNRINQPQTAYLVEVQCTAIAILQNRALALDERLAMLGFFLSEAQETIDTQGVAALDDVIAAFTAPDFTNAFGELTTGFSFSAETYLQRLIGDVGNALYDENRILDEQHAALVETAMQTLGFSPERQSVNLPQLANDCERGFLSYKRRLVREYDYIWENFLVNELFQQLYPFNIGNSLTDGYKVFLSEYKLAELFVTAYAYGCRAETNDRFLAAALADANRSAAHDVDYIPDLCKIVLAKDENIISFMNAYLDMTK